MSLNRCCPWPEHCACRPQPTCLPPSGAPASLDLGRSGEGWEHVLERLLVEAAAR